MCFDQHGFQAGLAGGDRRCAAGRACANYQDICVLLRHAVTCKLRLN
jgi:hypothetical protein